MLRRLYSYFWNMKLMKQLFLVNAVIMCLTVAAAAMMIFSNLWDSYIGNEIEFNRSAAISLRDFMIGKENFAEKTSMEGFTNTGRYDWPLLYMEAVGSPELYSSSDLSGMKVNLIKYMESRYGADNNLTTIILYSGTEDRAYPFSRAGSLVSSVEESTIDYMRQHLSRETLDVTVLPAVFESYSKSRSYSMVQNVRSKTGYEFNGVIKYDFSTDSVTEYLSRYYSSANGRFVITTTEGGVIYDSYDMAYGSVFVQENMTTDFGGFTTSADKSCYINVEESQRLGIKIYGILSKQELGRGFASGIWLLFLILAVGISGFLAASYVISRRRGRQIDAITSIMQENRKGNLSKRIAPARSRNELYTISEAYNETLDELESYVNRVYVLELSSKQFQLSALQAQINPHFLYNTLEVIRMRALSDGAEDAAEMTYILSRLFRSSIKDSRFTTIRQETEHCRDYLRLHEIRFKDNFSYDFNLDEGISGNMVIRHILQPILENYLIHGFDSERTDNHVSVSAELREDMIYFIIKDNGIGIKKDELESIRSNLNEKSAVDSIGLQNIHQRIGLVYGKGCGLSIESGDEGTRVTLTVRNSTEEELIRFVQGGNS